MLAKKSALFSCAGFSAVTAGVAVIFPTVLPQEDQGYCLNVFDNHQYGLVIGSLAMMARTPAGCLPSNLNHHFPSKYSDVCQTPCDNAGNKQTKTKGNKKNGHNRIEIVRKILAFKTKSVLIPVFVTLFAEIKRNV